MLTLEDGLLTSEAMSGCPETKAERVDKHVGARLRERRTMLGLSLQQLAAMIGVASQQAHKYETGVNRVSAGRLFQVAVALGVPIGWFFDGLIGDAACGAPPKRGATLDLARNFNAIANEQHRQALSELAQTLAEQSLAAHRAHKASPDPAA